jgi:hypothetical protein
VKEETKQNKKLTARATAQERSSFGSESSERLALSLASCLSGKCSLLTHSAPGELAVLLLTGRMPCAAQISSGQFLGQGLEAICRGREGRLISNEL